MVRRYSSSYRSEQAATRHFRFSPADQMLGNSTDSPQAGAAVEQTPVPLTPLLTPERAVSG